MRLSNQSDVLASLLTSRPRPAPVKGQSPAERAEELRRKAVAAFAHWGHLRCAELARLLWPESKHAEQLSQRLVRRLEALGLVVTRPNAVGTRSFVLTRPGAAYAEALGLEARHGLDISSCAGATFIHRSIATRYGIEEELRGRKAYGEHAMASPICPVARDTLRVALGKLPDLVVCRGNDADIVEVECAAKAKQELQRCLAIASNVGRRFTDTQLRLASLIFVCDARLNHEARIRRAASELWASRSKAERADLAGRVQLVNVQLGPCAKWLGVSAPKRLEI